MLAILFGSFGIHKFILGYTREGVIIVLASTIGSLFTGGLAFLAMVILGIIEGIIYLRINDDEYERTYIQGNKPWF